MDTKQLSKDHLLLHRSGPNKKQIISRFNATSLNFPLDLKVHQDLQYNSYSKNDQEDTIKCTFDNNKSDNIMKVYYYFKIPHVAVADKWAGKVQIRWTNKIAHNIVGSTLLKIMCNKNGTNQNINAFYTDPIWNDIYYSYFVEDKDLYDDKIGQIEELSKWSRSLPEVDVETKIPWIWSDFMSQSFPIHNNEGSIILENTFTILTSNQISKFLMMRVLDGGEWKYIKPTDDISKYINTNNIHESDIPQPAVEYHSDSASDSDASETNGSLHGSIRNGSTPSSRNHFVRKKKSKNNRRITRFNRMRENRDTLSAMNLLIFEKDKNRPRILLSGTKQDSVFLQEHIAAQPLVKYFTYDIVQLTKEDVTPGSKRTIFIDTRDLIHSLYIIAQNKQALRYNNYSNYTTNAIEPECGVNPIKFMTIKVGETVVFDGDSIMLGTVARESLPAYPREGGYNAYSFSFNAISPHNDTSIRSVSPTQITLDIVFEKLDESEEDTDFTLYVYSNVKRQVTHNRKTNEINVLRESFIE